MDIWRTLPPLAALRAFAAWAETGSMTAAGQALNVSHAAISQQIRGLEAHLGLALVDRGGSQPRPTPEGARLAEALLAGFGGMARVVADLTGADAGRPVQITTSPGFASSWLVPRLARFRVAHPEISVMLDPATELRPLTPGGIDLALRYGNGDWPGMEAHLLMPTTLVVVAAPLLAKGITAGDLAALSRLPRIEETGSADHDAVFRQHASPPEARVATLSMPGSMKMDAVRDGQGIAITSRIFVEADVAAGRLRVLHELVNGKGYWLVHRPEPLRPPARAFARWVRREAAERP